MYIAKIIGYQYTGGSVGQVAVDFYNGSTYLTSGGPTFTSVGTRNSAADDAVAESAVSSLATSLGYTGATVQWQTATPASVAVQIASALPPARSFNNAASPTIQTSTGAVGDQISATRDAQVSYSPTMITTASISGNASDVIVLEVAATNSATAGDWKEISRVTNAQALTLAITLQSVQTTSGVLTGIVPAGYYRKIRAITSGTVSNSMSSGQEVLI